MLETVKAKNVDEKKNGFICLVSMFPSCAMVPKLFKKVHLLQFYVDFSKKLESIEAL